MVFGHDQACPRNSNGNSRLNGESDDHEARARGCPTGSGPVPHSGRAPHTLPARWYTDPEIFALERERIFHRSWWYAGNAAEVAEPGSYVTTSLLDQDIVIIRGRDRELRAFYNVCSHRGHRLLEGKGRESVIVCPYHNWCYQTDGRFRSARGIDLVCDFDRQAANLKPVHVGICANLLFVNLDPAAEPLSALSSEMAADMAAHCPGLERLTLVHHHEVETRANWKTLVDNDLESYHAEVAHPALMGLLDYGTFEVWEYPGPTCHAMTNTNPDNTAYRVGANDPVKRAIYTWLWPNTAFFIAPGRNNLAIFQIIPTGPETSLQHWDFYFEDTALTDSEKAYLDYTCDVLIPEDTSLYENVQRGLRSRGYDQGRLVINRDKPEWNEHHVHLFQKLVRDP